MNWGWKIAITYTLFAVMTLAFVFFAATKKVNLVEEDYYEKEIKYQEQIERIKNARELSDAFIIMYNTNNALLSLHYAGKESLKGEVHLFRPSDSELDLLLPLNLDNKGNQVVDARTLLKGFWVVKVTWEASGKSYFKSQQIDIQ